MDDLDPYSGVRHFQDDQSWQACQTRSPRGLRGIDEVAGTCEGARPCTGQIRLTEVAVSELLGRDRTTQLSSDLQPSKPHPDAKCTKTPDSSEAFGFDRPYLDAYLVG